MYLLDVVIYTDIQVIYEIVSSGINSVHKRPTRYETAVTCFLRSPDFIAGLERVRIAGHFPFCERSKPCPTDDPDFKPGLVATGDQFIG